MTEFEILELFPILVPFPITVKGPICAERDCSISAKNQSHEIAVRKMITKR